MTVRQRDTTLTNTCKAAADLGAGGGGGGGGGGGCCLTVEVIMLIYIINCINFHLQRRLSMGVDRAPTGPANCATVKAKK